MTSESITITRSELTGKDGGILETGIRQIAALALYKSAGFQTIPL